MLVFIMAKPKHKGAVQVSHFDLVSSLYRYLIDRGAPIVFREPGLGSRYKNLGSIPIPDIYTFNKSYTNTMATIYEVKHSRSDFLGDVKKAKWERYLPYCDRLYFALDKSISYEEIQHQPVGIIIHNAGKWSVKRTAPKNAHRQPITEEVFLSLLFSKHENEKATRLSRLEATREKLLKAELHDLYKLHWGKLSELAYKLDVEKEKYKFQYEEVLKEVRAEVASKLVVYVSR